VSYLLLTTFVFSNLQKSLYFHFLQADPVIQRYARQQQQLQQPQQLQLPKQYIQKVQPAAARKAAAVAPHQLKFLPQPRQPQQQQLIKHGDHYDVKDNEIDSLYAPVDQQQQQQQQQQQYFYPGELQGT
jgi:hypothetical protein